MEIINEVPAKKTKRLTSVVWNHFERVRKADAQYAVCVHCKKKLSGSSNSGTTHLRNHLVRCLKRSNFDVSQILSAKRKRNETSQSPLGQSNLAVAAISYDEGRIKDEILNPMPLKFEHEQTKEEAIQTINLGSVKFDQERSRLDLARMIMLHGYPLAMVNHVGFKIFVKNLQPLFDVNNNDGAIEMDCLTIYNKEKHKLYEAIRHFHGRISLAVDMWGSHESAGYVCLTANYIDDDWRLQKKMLNFISLDPSHTDDVLSEVVIKSLTDWAIDHKLFSMTFDDCSAHEIMVFRIKDWLSQNRPFFKDGELFDVRCVTHLLKSIVQEVMEACHDLIHKIRESVRHVKSTQTLLGKFNEIAQQAGISSVRRLVLDSLMQWKSTYLMLESAIEYRGAFSLLQEHDSSYTKALSETEWEWASSIAGFLKFLLDFTTIVVGNKYATANIFFSEICDMHIQLIEWCRSPDDFLSSVALKMKDRFDTYWSKCSLGLAIAAILDPRFKMKLVEYYYGQIYASTAPDRIKEVADGLRELFTEYLMASSSPDQDSVLSGSSLPSTSSASRDKLKGFDKFLYETSQSQSMSSDLEKYLEEPVFPRNCDFSILNWWKVHTPRYPILSVMARDILAISVSTLGPEVAFSNTGRTLDQDHSSLTPDTREALVCGQDWLRMEPEASLALINVHAPLPISTETN
ncbi:zinc finger BED domain-containing protein RICESLEEPER 1-like isoform X2 [Salvia splendens]|uniref:zinc finger BED domain-containing protein RICESLEEPER 1-like isoform X2 n=1 Tax=Salvia splendens TaxID=180675 RepID=UPI001C266134|nr:zinc finger BED domain-containing protein RICESLEEPER 1-like isoform X2 [Salvia splendens]XP_042065980.1 zinc finger BED domain-containing protein RICESLEEPER 1-like isoform X2 [Salvia splendens]